MTANGLLGELAAWTGLASPPAASTRPMAASAATDALAGADGGLDRSKISGILDVCDRVVGEMSKRGHVFESLTGELVTVDAYYPRDQIVVLCQDHPDPYAGVTAESAAKQGLRLLEIDLREFRDDSGQAFSRLIGELRVLAPATPRVPAPAGAQVPAIRWAGAAPPRTVAPPPQVAPPPVAPPPVAPPPVFRSAPAPPPAPPPRFAPPGPIPAPPPFPPLTTPHPSARRPAAAAPRPSVSAALQAAVHRFTAAPEPFVLPREPDPPTAPTGPAVPPPASVPRPAPPPLPAASSAPPPYPTARAPAPPAPPAPAHEAAADSLSPLAFDRLVPMTDPVLAHLAHLGPRPAPERARRRVGQRQAEAAARAARFVEARGVRNAARYPAARAIATRSPGPAFGRQPAGVNPWAPAPALAQPGGLAQTTVPTQAPAIPQLPAFARTPLLAPDPPAQPRSNSRAARIERAIAHGRTAPDPRRRTAPDPRARTGADSRGRPAQSARTRAAASPTAATARPAAKPVATEDVLALGLVVGSIVLLELVLGVILAVSGGPVVLGLGLALDAAARALGTLAAVYSGEEWGPGWPWACGLIGSPAVAAFAFNGDGSPAAVELAPLAGPLAAVAIVTLVIGLAGIPFGV